MRNKSGKEDMQAGGGKEGRRSLGGDEYTVRKPLPVLEEGGYRESSCTGIREAIRQQVLEELDSRLQVSDEELLELIDNHIMKAGEQQYLPLKERVALRSSLFDSFRRLDILQELVDNPEITEIMVNGKDNIFTESHGRISRWNKCFTGREQLEDIIQQIVSRVNRIVNVSSPIVDARLPDGSRVHVVLAPVALDGPILTIRKFPEPITMDRLISLGSLTEDAAMFLKKVVRAGYNIFVSGGTGAGKTTFLNALSEFIPGEERLITIEDSAELQIRHIPNLVRLETRNANSEGEGAVTIGDLIRAALRMNPTRIIVGEVRGGEALEMLQSMNTGHDGSISTGHGNNPKDMLSRLETMVLMAADLPLPAIRSQIASALDIMVHVGRLRDKSRKVLMITEVERYEGGEIFLNPLYQFQEGTGREGQEAGGLESAPVGQQRRKGVGGHDRERVIAPEGRVDGALEKVGRIKNIEKLLAAGIVL